MDHFEISCSGFVCVFQLWDLEESKKRADCSGHLSWVHRVQFSHDGSQLLSCSDDQTVRVRLNVYVMYLYHVARDTVSTDLITSSDGKIMLLWNITSLLIELCSPPCQLLLFSG